MRTVRQLVVPGLGPLPLTMPVADSLSLTGLGRDATYAAIERGEIPAIRVNRTIRVLTIPLLRQLGYDLELDQAAPDNNEEPPAGDSSTNLTPPKDRSDHEYRTSEPEQPAASGLRAVH